MGIQNRFHLRTKNKLELEFISRVSKLISFSYQCPACDADIKKAAAVQPVFCPQRVHLLSSLKLFWC